MIKTVYTWILALIFVLAIAGTVNAEVTLVNITDPANMSWFDNGDVTVTFNATSNTNDTAFRCDLLVNTTPTGYNESVVNNTLAIILVNSTLSEGSYSLVVSCDDDDASNTSTAIIVNVDTTAPSSAVTIPAYIGPNTWSQETTIVGTASDTGIGVKNVTIVIQRSSDSQYWNGIDTWGGSPTNLLVYYNVSEDTWVYNATNLTSELSNGVIYNITPTATDNLSNSIAGTSGSFTYDDVAPTYVISYTAVGPVNEDTVVTINATFNEPMLITNIPQIALAVGEGNPATLSAINMVRQSDNVYTYDWTVGVGDGVLVPEVTVGTDLAGNVVTNAGSTRTNVTVDNTAPTGYSVDFNVGVVNSDNEGSVSFNFTGAEVGATYIYVITSSGGAGSVSNSGSVATVNQTISSIDVSGLPDGTLTLSFNLTDIAGNQGANVQDTVTKDTVAPTVNSVVPSPILLSESSVGVGGFTVTVVFSKSMNELVDANIAFNPALATTLTGCNGAWSDATTWVETCNVEDVDVEEADVDVQVSLATDLAGNVMVADTVTGTDAFSVDTLAPTVDDLSVDLAVVSVANNQIEVVVNFSETMNISIVPMINFSVGTWMPDGDGVWSASDTVFTRSYNLSDAIEVSDVNVIVNAGVDLAGNVMSQHTAIDKFDIDTVPPTVTSVVISPSEGFAKVGDVITVTITADSIGYSAGTILVNGIAATGFTDNADNTYTVTYTVVEGHTDRAQGDLPVSVVLNDSAGNENTLFTSVTANTLAVDANTPTGYSVDFNVGVVNSDNEGSVSFNFTGAEVGATYIYVITSSGGAGSVSNSGSVATVNQTISSIDVSGLPDGTLTLSFNLTDIAGNQGTSVTDTVAKNTVAPLLTYVSISSDNVNTAYARVGDNVTVSFNSSENIQTPVVTVDGNAATVLGSDSSWLAYYVMQTGDNEGVVSYTIDFEDLVGNGGVQITSSTDSTQVTYDETAPTGYTVEFGVSFVNIANEESVSFTFAGAEIGATYAFVITSSGGAGSVSDTGTIASVDQTIGGIDVSSLDDGTLTLNVTLTDIAGNQGSVVQDNVSKDTVLPKLTSELNATNNTDGSLTLSWDEVTQDVNDDLESGVSYWVFRTLNLSELNLSSTDERVNVTLSLNFTDTTITTDDNYTYVVTTVDDAGNHNNTLTASNRAIIEATACSTEWSAWSSWSACSGGEQSRTRTRTCYGGGETVQTETQSCTISSGGRSGSGAFPPGIGVASQVSQGKVNFSRAGVWFFSGIRPNEQSSLDTSGQNMSIRQIRINARRNVNNLEIRMGEFASGIEPTTTKPRGQIFKYLEITANQLIDESVESIMFEFTVPLEWIGYQGATPQDVKLYRFVSSAWIPLQTTLLREEGGMAYYEAVTSGLSYFAITSGLDTIVTPPPTTTPVEPVAEPVVEDRLPVQEEVPPTIVPEEPVKRGMGLWAWFGIFVLLVAIAIAGILFLNKTNKSEYEKFKDELKEESEKPKEHSHKKNKN